MMRNTIQYLLITLLATGALAACMPVQAPAADSTTNGTPAATPAATTVSDLVTPPPLMVEPLDEAACASWQTTLATALGVDFTMTDTDFASEATNFEGRACALTANGTGEDFGNFVDTAQSIRDLMQAEGWSENPAYLADGPTGTRSGYENGEQLALVSAGWTPAEDADCPDDQPISACELEPSQQLYTVEVLLMQFVQ